MNITIEPDPPATPDRPNPFPRPAEIARAEISKTNGAKSCGPATPGGLAQSSRNSLRHGLTAQAVSPQAVVLETESQEEFALLLHSFLDRFQPADAVEQELVEAMAAARWRLRRLYAIESTILDNELMRREDSIEREFIEVDDNDRLAHAFQSLADNGRSLALLVRYEAGLNRAFDRALKQLILLQSGSPPTPIPHVGSFRSPRPRPTPAAALISCPVAETPSSAAQTPSPAIAAPSPIAAAPPNPPPARPKRVE